MRSAVRGLSWEAQERMLAPGGKVQLSEEDGPPASDAEDEGREDEPTGEEERDQESEVQRLEDDGGDDPEDEGADEDGDGTPVQRKADGDEEEPGDGDDAAKPDDEAPGDADEAAGEEPVQRKARGGRARRIHRAAAEGLAGTSQPLPHLDPIQASFGHHDVTGVEAHVGGAAERASRDMKAHAYATGNSVAFARSPDLHTAAHEAAHVVQQRGGVSLKRGVGQSGDAYEHHADRVADLVVQGRSAQSLLDSVATPGPRRRAEEAVAPDQVQCKEEADEEEPDDDEVEEGGPEVQLLGDDEADDEQGGEEAEEAATDQDAEDEGGASGDVQLKRTKKRRTKPKGMKAGPGKKKKGKKRRKKSPLAGVPELYESIDAAAVWYTPRRWARWDKKLAKSDQLFGALTRPLLKTDDWTLANVQKLAAAAQGDKKASREAARLISKVKPGQRVEGLEVKRTLVAFLVNAIVNRLKCTVAISPGRLELLRTGTNPESRVTHVSQLVPKSAAVMLARLAALHKAHPRAGFKLTKLQERALRGLFASLKKPKRNKKEKKWPYRRRLRAWRKRRYRAWSRLVGLDGLLRQASTCTPQEQVKLATLIKASFNEELERELPAGGSGKARKAPKSAAKALGLSKREKLILAALEKLANSGPPLSRKAMYARQKRRYRQLKKQALANPPKRQKKEKKYKFKRRLRAWRRQQLRTIAGFEPSMEYHQNTARRREMWKRGKKRAQQTLAQLQGWIAKVKGAKKADKADWIAQAKLAIASPKVEQLFNRMVMPSGGTKTDGGGAFLVNRRMKGGRDPKEHGGTVREYQRRVSLAALASVVMKDTSSFCYAWNSDVFWRAGMRVIDQPQRRLDDHRTFHWTQNTRQPGGRNAGEMLKRHGAHKRRYDALVKAQNLVVEHLKASLALEKALGAKKASDKPKWSWLAKAATALHGHFEAEIAAAKKRITELKKRRRRRWEQRRLYRLIKRLRSALGQLTKLLALGKAPKVKPNKKKGKRAKHTPPAVTRGHVKILAGLEALAAQIAAEKIEYGHRGVWKAIRRLLGRARRVGAAATVGAVKRTIKKEHKDSARLEPYPASSYRDIRPGDWVYYYNANRSAIGGHSGIIVRWLEHPKDGPYRKMRRRKDKRREFSIYYGKALIASRRDEERGGEVHVQLLGPFHAEFGIYPITNVRRVRKMHRDAR